MMCRLHKAPKSSKRVSPSLSSVCPPCSPSLFMGLGMRSGGSIPPPPRVNWNVDFRAKNVDFRALVLPYFQGKISVMIINYQAKFSGQNPSALSIKFLPVRHGDLITLAKDMRLLLAHSSKIKFCKINVAPTLSHRGRSLGKIPRGAVQILSA